MQGMRKTLYTGCVVAALFLTSCSTQYTLYSRNLFDGKNLFQLKEYAQAKQAFLAAYEAEKNVPALAWAATACYWLNDLEGAERYLKEAEAQPRATKSFSYLRIMGYKALVLLKQGKKQEGIEALKAYVYAYGNTFASSNLATIQFMANKGDVDLPRLQVMIEGDVWEYEQAVATFEQNGVGYLDKAGRADAGSGGPP